MRGLKGEETIDDSVWLIKAHNPVLHIPEKSFEVNKAICSVRNPIDAIVSEFNLILTWTHDEKVKQDFHIDFKEDWEIFVKKEFDLWVAYHLFWI